MLATLETLNRVFEAGIAITALSLFLRSLTINLRDRVSRAFAVILASMMVSSAGEAVAASLAGQAGLDFWLHFQWLGTIFLPAGYLHFSDALLETTGRPSRGRRRLAVRLSYLISAVFVVLLSMGLLLGPPVPNGEPVPYLGRTSLSWVFTAYYLIIIVLALSVMWRAWQRTVLSASRRRMTYLLIGSLVLALGAYPFLLVGSGLAASFPEIFLFSAAVGSILVFWAMVAMAYATAFFGVPWPDRVVKSRLFRWLVRGPATVFIVLLLLPGVGQISEVFRTSEAIMLPILVALSALLTSHVLTLALPTLENWLLFSGEGADAQFVQNLQERVLTNSDLRQFLEALLSAVCDRFQTQSAFVAMLEDGKVQQLLEVGDKKLLGKKKKASSELEQLAQRAHGDPHIFSWDSFWLLPLYAAQGQILIGLLGVRRTRKLELSEEQHEALLSLGERAALAIDDRRQQTQALSSLQTLGPRVDLIQRLRAASRFDQSEVLSDFGSLPEYSDLVRWVKEALTHYWGGPRLTDSPLRGLQVVQRALKVHDGNPAQAMRSILQEAIERNKPEGEPRLNGEWMLYNLLEMKFLQGRKVREVASRLAMSEADLYRKQRVAIEAVARSLLEMETNMIEQHNGKDERK
ncbi:MAG: hypothetical protein M1347_05335 [Chloroflexi bacterium]|nr:hypothetical protein [Chloroflexota bacterium]